MAAPILPNLTLPCHGIGEVEIRIALAQLAECVERGLPPAFEFVGRQFPARQSGAFPQLPDRLHHGRFCLGRERPLGWLIFQWRRHHTNFAAAHFLRQLNVQLAVSVGFEEDGE